MTSDQQFLKSMHIAPETIVAEQPSETTWTDKQIDKLLSGIRYEEYLDGLDNDELRDLVWEQRKLIADWRKIATEVTVQRNNLRVKLGNAKVIVSALLCVAWMEMLAILWFGLGR